jgi:hypothetical protein
LLQPFCQRRFETLDVYGINQVNLFPDLDGLSRHINWETRVMVEKRDNKDTDRHFQDEY